MEYSFCVDVSIWHPSIDPDEITDALHRRPSRSVKVGELPARKRSGKSSDGLRPARVTTWMIDLHPESRLNFPEVEPDDIVRTFLSTLDEEERSFLRRMSAEGRGNDGVRLHGRRERGRLPEPRCRPRVFAVRL